MTVGAIASEPGMAVVVMGTASLTAASELEAHTGWPLIFMQTSPCSMLNVSLLAPVLLFVVATATIEPCLD